jgi:sulfatase maturation enzyme AslB (radical SAM superfamily)
MDDTLYCALASNSISFGANGSIRPCCAVDTNYWNDRNVKPTSVMLQDNSIIKWVNSNALVSLRSKLLNNQWDPICNLCRGRERHGQESTRQIFNNTLQQLENTSNKNLHVYESVLPDLSNIFLLDITVGNTCNSACLMCNASASSLWKKEQEIITGKKINWITPDWFTEEQIPNLIDNLPNLSAIQFLGGEPTINEPHIFLLKRLISQGRAKNITLGYVTNLTGVSDELVELWSHFSTKHITISIDGVGPVNEYIRYPFTWKKVVSQLENLKEISNLQGNYHIGLSHTVISLNLLTLDTLIDWWETQLETNSNMLKSLPHIQCVNNPGYFDPVYMPDEMKEKARETLLRLIKLADDRHLGEKYSSVINHIATSVIYNQVDPKIQLSKWIEMQNFIQSLDKHRNRNIFNYIPYLKEYWI